MRQTVRIPDRAANIEAGGIFRRAEGSSAMSLIYCLEDDAGIRNLILYTLDSTGFEGRGFAESRTFWAAVDEAVPQLVLLDIMLPGEDGVQVLKKLRERPATARVPVIMATAKGTEFDKVMGLDLGADDYLAKPFGMMEMVSRIRAVLRRAAPPEDGDVLRAGSLVLNTREHTVTVDGERVALTFKEYGLLRLLMANPGRAFDRETLLRQIWDTEYAGETRTVDVHIRSLRAKLGPAAGCIETVRGVGYRLEDKR